VYRDAIYLEEYKKERKRGSSNNSLLSLLQGYISISLILIPTQKKTKTKTKKTPVSLCTAAGRVKLVQNNPKQKPKKDEGDLFLIRFV
jgi:hypothetical protein